MVLLGLLKFDITIGGIYYSTVQRCIAPNVTANGQRVSPLCSKTLDEYCKKLTEWEIFVSKLALRITNIVKFKVLHTSFICSIEEYPASLFLFQ